MKNQKLTWQEIVSRYPDRWVGLTNIEREEHSADIKSAIVVCTSDNVSEDKMLKMVFNGELETSIFTTPDNNFQLGAIQ